MFFSYFFLKKNTDLNNYLIKYLTKGKPDSYMK